ncbi:hypothetical protein PC9H_007452 [Pleurotus ostreatus]|uniref:F-box domain-containing protein n=1 Tax=Pleurotus ostreatus TaxID=5322 RepID=A0A8H6ZTY6_PLEOS|nr:uncharacterized protein PC9H_007452 [Pleurotus ostreatus]KAF7428231.1 hypothetical protein PC9H_007452 [Pleurotus ostreatus]
MSREQHTGLPLDIWVNIFEFTLPECKFTRPSPSTAPLLLCRVSQSWRNLAIALPSLWSSLAIEVYLGSATPREELVFAFLLRSGSVPLSLSLRQLDYSAATETLTEALTHHIGPRVSQARHLSLMLSHLGKRRSPFFVPMPELETMELHISCPFTWAESNALINNFRNAPKLKELKLAALHWPPARPDIREEGDDDMSDIGWSLQLSSASINMLSDPSVATQYLAKWPKLSHYQVWVTEIPLSTNRMPVIHQHLRKLDLGVDRYPTLAADFLCRLTLPALEELSVTLHSPDYMTHSRFGVVDFLTKSQCRLRKLKLCETSMEPQELREIIHHPALETLECFNVTELRGNQVWGWGDSVRPTLQALTSTRRRGENQAPTILPSLRHLQIVGPSFAAESELLVKLAIARWRIPIEGQRLESFTSSVINTEAGIKAIFELIVEGLRWEIV